MQSNKVQSSVLPRSKGLDYQLLLLVGVLSLLLALSSIGE